MVDKLYHRANLRSSFRPIARFAVVLFSFVCDHATPPIIKKLWSKGIAMHVYGVSVYYAKSIIWTWVEPFEMNVKIERGSNLNLDNEPLLQYLGNLG